MTTPRKKKVSAPSAPVVPTPPPDPSPSTPAEVIPVSPADGDTPAASAAAPVVASAPAEAAPSLALRGCVRVGGRTYRAGDEAAFARVAASLAPADLARLRAAGVLAGALADAGA